MHTILAPFHPYLEDALVEEITGYKALDPLRPLLILVPSESLRRRLKILLTGERQLALLNLPILTFYQFSLRLYGEAHPKPLELRGDLFLEETLRQIIRTRQPGAEPFAGIEERVGGCAALWQTLRDLRDGLVDPAVALEALREGHFSARTSQRTSDLLVLLQTLLRFCSDQAIYDQSDLDKAAVEEISSSSWLKQFGKVFYYGFYDLTQLQIDSFHGVARNNPTTLFFPLLATRPSHEAWRFAERFYERYVEGHNTAAPAEPIAPVGALLPMPFKLFDQRSDRPYRSVAEDWHCTITNAFGIHDEVAAAAKEILRLVDDHAMPFDDIGVVARSLDAYGPTITAIFADHRIPIANPLPEPLTQFPLTKAVTQLLQLPAKDFPRAEVIDLVSSPFFQRQSIGTGDSLGRADLWDLASRELAICKGVAEWRRLRNYANRDLLISQISEDDEPRMIRVSAAELQHLADIVEHLAADLLKLPAQASWHEYAAAWQAFLKTYLAVGVARDSPPGPLQEKIIDLLGQLAGLDAIESQVSLSDFSHAFQHWLEHAEVAAAAANHDGVAVLNATAARGLPFRALFLLGLNEGVFPRTIREDAFLRDHDREILERDLGYKISQKLAAFDEEKLLFTLLANAARERLYCSYQRADDSGRALAPSWYLNELGRLLDGSARVIQQTIPHSSTDKVAVEIFNRESLLRPEELVIRQSLEGQDPTQLVEACALSPALYRQGRQVVIALDQSADRLQPFDGAVGALEHYWQHVSGHGLVPTALETYARCPFQFFARHVLGLQRLDQPEENLGPSPAQFGELGHAILNGFFESLIARGYFAGPRADTDLDELLIAIAGRYFAQYAAQNPVGYPLAWETLKEGLVELIGRVIRQDLDELAASGYQPVALEVNATDQLPADWPDPLKGLKARGRMDRIDRNSERNKLRIIDYKFKFGANPAAQDKDLYRAALRGERLQPPIYLRLGQRWAETEGAHAAEVSAQFYFIAPRWSDGPLVSSEFGADGLVGKLGNETKNTMACLAQGIQSGSFFIRRGDYCGHCEVAEICRKNHPPSLWRAENDPVTQVHRQLRDKDPKKL